MHDTREVGGLRMLLFAGVLGFKGDACICGGAKQRPPQPPTSSSAEPAGSSSATP